VTTAYDGEANELIRIDEAMERVVQHPSVDSEFEPLPPRMATFVT
jgi:hypothetical protein